MAVPGDLLKSWASRVLWYGFPRKKISRDRAHASTGMLGLRGLENILSLHLVVGVVARASSGMWISALVWETLVH